MATKLKAADLIGNTIKINGVNNMKYVVKSASGDKLITDFYAAGRAPMECPLPIAQLENMLATKKWVIADAESASVNEVQEVEEVQEVNDVEEIVDTEEVQEVPEEVEEKKVKADEKKVTIKRKVTLKRKQVDPETPSRTLTYSTYTTKKGKTGAKIIGFSEQDAAYLAGPELHGAKVWEFDKAGKRVYCLLFSHRYAEAAKELCEALNAGKDIEECKAIIDACTEERAQKREEWKAKREEYNNAKAEEHKNTKKGKAAKSSGTVFTEEQVRKMFAVLAKSSGMPENSFDAIIDAVKAA